jgi:RimJ/RimL family protein N-acetyltransferase
VEPTAQSTEQIVLNIIGEKVALGPLRRDLLPLYHRWFNDFQVTHTMSLRSGPKTEESVADWYERVGGSESDIFFTIYEYPGLRAIGTGNLHQLDLHHRTASFGIWIGEKECWGGGYGAEVTALMLDYGFTALGLHNIMLTVVSYNERGLRAYRKAGFREIGRRRGAWRLANRVYDVIYMECLATEFESRRLSWLLEPEGSRD